MGFVFFQLQRQADRIIPGVQNGIFQQFSRSTVLPPSLYKKMSMLKVVHQSFLTK